MIRSPFAKPKKPSRVTLAAAREVIGHERGAAAVGSGRANFWSRTISRATDFAILAVLCLILPKPMRQLVIIAFLFLGYFAFTEIYFSRSVGKFLQGIRITDASGEALSRRSRAIRLAIKALFCIFWPLGCVSWKRVSPLDWITRTRAEARITPPPRKNLVPIR